MKIKELEDLEAWQEARKLCLGIYEITKTFPKDEKYNITKHLRESGRGGMGNIAEGYGRYFYKDSNVFYNIAKGCLNEIKSDLYLSHDLKYIKDKQMLERFINQINKVLAMVNRMIISSINQYNKDVKRKKSKEKDEVKRK